MAIVHGYGEHAGRYRELAEVLARAGFEAHLVDLRGHGLSEGARGHVERFEDYFFEVRALVERAEAGGGPFFLFGHSLGALILLRYLQEGGRAAGAIVSAPYLQLAFTPPAWKRMAAGLLRLLMPRLPIDSGIRAENLTRDEARRDEVRADPLYFTTTTAGWFFEASRAQEEARAKAAAIELPILGILPTADRIADPATTAAFWERLGAKDRRLERFEDCFHEVLNEPREIRQRAHALILGWIEARLPREGEASGESFPAGSS